MVRIAVERDEGELLVELEVDGCYRVERTAAVIGVVTGMSIAYGVTRYRTEPCGIDSVELTDEELQHAQEAWRERWAEDADDRRAERCWDGTVLL